MQNIITHKKIIFLLILLFFLFSISTAFAQEHAKNIILFVGDGMGFAHISISKYYLGRDLFMEQLPYSGFVTTHSEDSYVTDSAAAATALACGFKTKNRMLGWLPQGETPKTVLEAAQEKGKKVGLVSTCRLTHATPAAFAAHVIHRNKETEIARQMLERNVDVLLGGGLKQFLHEKPDKPLVEQAKSQGYEFVQTRDEMLNATSDKILGLFTKSHMNYELDRNPDVEPSLAEMTQKSLAIVSQDEDGFFLMVEGGRIDHAAHKSDIGGVVTDLLAFDEAINVALEFAKKDTNTLIIVTSDHECGGLGLSNGKYEIKPEVIKNINHSVEFAMEKIEKENADVEKIMVDYFGITDMTVEEREKIKNAPNPMVRMFSISEVVSDRAMVGWTTTKHTASLVPIMAIGPDAERYVGFMDNTDIPKKIDKSGGYELFE